MAVNYLSIGPNQTYAAGACLGKLLKQGDIIGLVGDLGAGKTMFVQGLASGLEVPKDVRVVSPTFSLINEYLGGRLSLVHVDLYRIEEEAEFENLGLEEMIDLAGVSAVEWCDRFPVLPSDHLLVSIMVEGEQVRRIVAEGNGPRSAHRSSEWNNVLECQ